MEKLQLNLPDMYADHHVLRVRAILAALAPGVENVVASSAFRIVAMDYDPAVIAPEAIKAALAESGYPIAAQPGTVNPVIPVRTGADPAWDRLGFRAARTDARDAKPGR